MEGILGAIDEFKREFDISVELIMCFLRHLEEASAMGAGDGQTLA